MNRLAFYYAYFMTRAGEVWEDFCQLAAWYVPRRLVYWCGVRMMAHASMVHDDTEMDAISPVQMLDAWDRHEEERP